MPRGDRTGPFGEGPMTGRAAGYCGGYDDPGYVSSPATGRGAARSSRRALGGGRGWVGGAGFRYRNRCFVTGAPFRAYGAAGAPAELTRDEEISLLKSESERLRSRLETIERRLADFEAG